MRRTLPLLLLALLTSVAYGQAYKWRDANGRIQYSDTPPPPGAKDVQQLSKPGASAATPSAGTKSTAEQDAEFRKRLTAKQEAEAKQAKSAADEQTRLKNCQSARSWLASLESGERVFLLNEKGERYAMEDSQRDQQRAEAQKAIDIWCK